MEFVETEDGQLAVVETNPIDWEATAKRRLELVEMRAQSVEAIDAQIALIDAMYAEALSRGIDTE